MKRSDRERIDDIRSALLAIRSHLAARTDEQLRRDAILYNLVVVGGAVKGLSEATKGQRPEIPWRQIAGVRDLITHEYFRIDMAEIEKIVDRDLRPLEKAIAALRRSAR